MSLNALGLFKAWTEWLNVSLQAWLSKMEGFCFFLFFPPNAQRPALDRNNLDPFTCRGLLFAGREMGASRDDPPISRRAEEFSPCRTTALSSARALRCRLFLLWTGAAPPPSLSQARDGSALGSMRAQRSHLTMSPDMKLSSRSPLAA